MKRKVLKEPESTFGATQEVQNCSNVVQASLKQVSDDLAASDLHGIFLNPQRGYLLLT
jgi:hypothetical protein